MQIEGIKLTLIMNFSVLDYSNLPPECLRLHRLVLILTFKIFRGACTRNPLKFSCFFSLVIAASHLSNAFVAGSGEATAVRLYSFCAHWTEMVPISLQGYRMFGCVSLLLLLLLFACLFLFLVLVFFSLWLLNIPATYKVYLRDRSPWTIVRAVTLRWKLQMKLSYVNQSQYTGTYGSSPSADPAAPGVWQGDH